MVELDKSQSKRIESIFDYTNETFVLSFTQGHMGRGWVDDLANPTCAQILVGDFCLIAGNPESKEAISLVQNIPAGYKSPWLIMAPQNEKWGNIIDVCYQDRARKCSRYAFKKERDCFCKEQLESYIDRLPDRYRIARIDETLYYQSLQQDFSKDFCSQFMSADDFLERGIGFCVLLNDEIVGGASSYTIYNDGIEIEVDIKKEYRRQGLASACASKLILECLARHQYPSWDAANKESAALAEKLGYRFDCEYDIYEIHCTSLNG